MLVGVFSIDETLTQKLLRQMRPRCYKCTNINPDIQGQQWSTQKKMQHLSFVNTLLAIAGMEGQSKNCTHN